MNRLLRQRLAARSPRTGQRGVVAIIVGLSMVVLVGFIGLAVDGGQLYLTKTELQNGADACALSASYELTGAPVISTSQFERAEAAGKAVAQRNKVAFQSTAITDAATIVRFSNSLTSSATWSTAATASPSSKYVRCTITRSGITPSFMQVLGFGDQSVSSIATATLAPAQSNCAIPMSICAKGAAPSFGLTRGQWVTGRFGAGGGITGNFNWIDFTPPSGGANEVTALLQGSGVCTLAGSVPVGQPGALGAAAATAWNTRFGVYRAGSPDESVAPPDFSGFSYTPTNWPSETNALTDFLARRDTRTPYSPAGAPSVVNGNTITGLGINPGPNRTSTTGQLTTSGADRRLVTAPIVDCGGWVSSTTTPVIGWACIFLLHPIDAVGDDVRMEYLGSSSASDSPCSTSGIAGDLTSIGPLVPALVQ